MTAIFLAQVHLDAKQPYIIMVSYANAYNLFTKNGKHRTGRELLLVCFKLYQDQVTELVWAPAIQDVICNVRATLTQNASCRWSNRCPESLA